MRVLVACEESQAVCKAFRALGHEAYSCDIQDCSGGHPEWHIKADALELLKMRWDLIIAHPPCTYLTNCGARWLYLPDGGLNEDRINRGGQAAIFFRRFLDADCPKICVENPAPSARWGLPKPTQYVQPYQFGHPVTKQTGLWLKGLPPLKPTNDLGRPKPQYYTRKDGTRRTTCWEMQQHGSKNRSKTFPGIAQAMAEQWGGDIRQEDAADE